MYPLEVPPYLPIVVVDYLDVVSAGLAVDEIPKPPDLRAGRRGGRRGRLALAGPARYGPLIGWDAAELTFLVWVWAAIAPMDAAATSVHAKREDPNQAISDLLLLVAAMASLVAVGVVLVGVDFNQDDPPRYTDFAYLAFTIGMTFQVSDTDIESHQVRAAALVHGLVSYLFGAVILATTVNFIVSLSSSS